MRNFALTMCLSLFAASRIMAAEDATSDFERLKSEATANSIPLVNLSIDIEQVTRDAYTQGTMEIFDPLSRTQGEQDITLNCKAKYRGSSAMSYEKKSFAIKTLDSNGEKADVSIFGIRDDDSWILDAMAIDRLRMRNRLCFDLWNEMSRTPYDTDCSNRNGTLGVFVEVFINGSYHGLYCMTDKINRKLLKLKKAKEADDGSIEIKGVLYKGAQWTDATNLLGYDTTQPFSSDAWNGWELQYPDDYPSEEAWQPLMDFIDLFQLSGEAFATTYTDYLYTDNLLDYALLIMATNYSDCIMKNTFLSCPNTTKGHRFLITPWDMDASLGGTWDGERTDLIFWESRFKNTVLFGRQIYHTDNFREQLAQKWGELSKTLFLPANFSERIDAYAEALTSSGAWQREYAKWNNNPVPLCENIADEAGYVKDWYARNHANVCSLFGAEAAIRAVHQGDTPANSAYTVGGIKLKDNDSARGIVIENGRKTLRR